MTTTDQARGPRSGRLTLDRVAELVGGRVEGDRSLVVAGVAPVDEAGPDQLAFLALKRYARFTAESAAGAFLVAEEMRSYVPEGRSCVVVADAYPALRALLTHIHPEEVPTPGVHPTAVLGRGVDLGADVHVGPYVVLDDDVTVGAGSAIGAHCVVGRGSSIGARTRLHPQVVVYRDSVIGSDVIVHSGVRIGSDGFGYTMVDGVHSKMPQIGRAVIEDGVEIGANTTVDRGSLGDTVVGAGAKIDNLVQVAHNVKVGALSLLAALVGVAGSTRLGKGVWVGGQAGIINQLDIGDGARITVTSGVFRDVPAGVTVSGTPARPHREEMRKQAQLARLPHLVERVDALEAELRRLSESS
jgi:UDP-3-O-[3-hydroxymyristoyl] glucosamine N-acyltransferase